MQETNCGRSATSELINGKNRTSLIWKSKTLKGNFGAGSHTEPYHNKVCRNRKDCFQKCHRKALLIVKNPQLKLCGNQGESVKRPLLRHTVSIMKSQCEKGELIRQLLLHPNLHSNKITFLGCITFYAFALTLDGPIILLLQ